MASKFCICCSSCRTSFCLCKGPTKLSVFIQLFLYCLNWIFLYESITICIMLCSLRQWNDSLYIQNISVWRGPNKIWFSIQTKSDFQMWIHFCTGKKLSQICVHFQINFLSFYIQIAMGNTHTSDWLHLRLEC